MTKGTIFQSIPVETISAAFLHESPPCPSIHCRGPFVWWPACSRLPSWPAAVDVSPVRPPLLPGTQRCGRRFGWWTNDGPQWYKSFPYWPGPTRPAPPGKSRMKILTSKASTFEECLVFTSTNSIDCTALPVWTCFLIFTGLLWWNLQAWCSLNSIQWIFTSFQWALSALAFTATLQYCCFCVCLTKVINTVFIACGIFLVFFSFIYLWHHFGGFISYSLQ